MREPEHFGEMLKEMRKSYGITQEQMADMLYMSAKNYGRIERGIVKLTPEKFYSYSKIFNRELFKHTGFVLDERFSPRDVLRKATKILEHILLGGK